MTGLIASVELSAHSVSASSDHADHSGSFREDVEEHVAVDEDGRRSPRVSARIACVLIRTDPRPRRRCTIDYSASSEVAGHIGHR
jgi:hypothetical protein